MDTTLILVYVVLPVLIIIAAFSKVIQEPVNKPYRVKKMSTREHRELFEAAFIAPMRIKPFPPDTHHEKETNYTTTKS